jgi:hypothetical protein
MDRTLTSEDFDRIEAKLDTLLEYSPALQALGEMLVEADYLAQVKGLNKKTISQNKKLEKFNEIGGRKLLVKIESVPVIQNRKKG